MIKENKDKQREKNGNSALKTDISGVQASASEGSVNEESIGESHPNDGEEGESSCKKNGLRMSGSTPSGPGSCALTDLKPALIGSSNVGTASVGSSRTSTSSQGSGELCLPDTSQEVKSEDGIPENPPPCTAVKTEINGNSSHEFTSNTPTGTSSTGDSCENVLPVGLPVPTPTGPPPNGVQPLPSNVINKQPGTMEAQYMQQQSQIFVFSTILANKSAEAVLQGQFPSIIAYHCAQPGTKKYLEKHPLKMNQFNRQNPAQWLNSLAQMKQKGGPGVMKSLPGGFQGPNVLGDIGTSPGSGGGVGIWNQTSSSSTTTTTTTNSSSSTPSISTTATTGSTNSNNTNNNANSASSSNNNAANNSTNNNSCNSSMINNINSVPSGGTPLMQPCTSSIVPGCPSTTSLTGAIKTPGSDSPCLMSASPSANPILPAALGTHSPSVPASNTPLLPAPSDVAGSPVMNHGNLSQPSLTGVKVPDENLTPQQRQHREEQLATLRKMQQMLFPEHQPGVPEGGGVGPPPEGVALHNLGPIMNIGPGPTGGGNAVINQKNLMAGVGGPGPLTPTSAAAQIEWQKLQHQFYEERKKKTPGLVAGGSASGLGSPVGPSTPSNGTVGSGVRGVSGQTTGAQGQGGSVVSSQASRVQGPPPPYHQTARSASVPTAMPSPNPGSPNNPTSNLSLPSPRATSGLNSPSDSSRSQFGIGGTSNSSARLMGPGPSPTGIHNTSLDSPSSNRPLNPSNPSTPVSTHLSPSASRKEGIQNGSDFSTLAQSASSQPISTTVSNHQPPVDGMFCRTLQSLAQQKQQQLPGTSAKEPNLMPVPSPQQIQYLNAFEGQELTIHKQPNTSLKDASMQSPSIPPSGLDVLPPTGAEITNTRLSGPGTPLTPTSVEFGSRCSSGAEPGRFQIPSPSTPGSEGRSQAPPQQQPHTPQPSQQQAQATPPQSQAAQQQQQQQQQPSQPPAPQTQVQPQPQQGQPGQQQSAQASSQQQPASAMAAQQQPTQSQQTPPQQQPLTPNQQSQVQQQPQSQPVPLQQPLTPQQQPSRERFAGPSPQSQGSCTPGLDTTIKTPTTEVNSRFLSGSPQLTDVAPSRYSNSGSSTTGTSPALGNQMQNFVQQTPPPMNIKVPSQFLDVSPSSSVSAPMDVSPTGSGTFTCLRSENVPLNPNGNGGTACSTKMAHFDPITSMAQMSQQLTSSVANSPGSQASSIMNSVPTGSCASGMLNFNSSGIHAMQMNDIGSCTGLSESQPPGGLVNPIGAGNGNQNGPGFVNMPMQGVPPHSYSPNSSVPSMVQCSGTVSTTSCMSQPIAHPNSSSSPKSGNMMMNMGPPRGSSPYASSPVPQRMLGRPPAPSPYNGANVQVKASAPNTIQYLPAKPQTGNSGPRGPPSLDFLQRFANPLSNLDTKVPTHNLQYFPNGQPNPVSVGAMNVPMNRPNGLVSGMNPQMGPLSGPNCGVGGPVGGPLSNLNGPLMGPNGPLVGMNLPMSGSMVMGPGGPNIGMVPLRGGIRPSGIMRMQQMGGSMFGVPSSPGQPVGSDQMFGGGPPQNIQSGGPNPQVFVPGSKSSPMGLGSAPDASQPLPPSMGQSNNFKSPPFIATSDPNYAQQFHNFQQQLYATNTRSQMNNQNVAPNQSFFVPK